jgi:hypothetical protein
MNAPINKTCCATKRDQSKCQASASPGSEFCFFHDPSKAEERREAQAQGGRQNRMKTLDATAADVNVEDCGDARALLVRTINQVLKGEIDPRIANSVGFLTNLLMKAVEQHELETRIEQLEELLKVQTTTFDLTLTGTDDEQLSEKQATGQDRTSADTEAMGDQTGRRDKTIPIS